MACGLVFTLGHLKFMWVTKHTCIREVYIIYQELHSDFTILQPPSKTMLSCENVTFHKICGAHVGGMWNGIYFLAHIIYGFALTYMHIQCLDYLSGATL